MVGPSCFSVSRGPPLVSPEGCVGSSSQSSICLELFEREPWPENGRIQWGSDWQDFWKDIRGLGVFILWTIVEI